MTITYGDGTVLEAVLLSHQPDRLRATVSGADDVSEFIRIHGTWISEDCEPVTIRFDWQRPAASIPTETDCICPKELAARLVGMLIAGSERDAVAANMLHVFSADGARVLVHRSQLGLN